ncbi:MAG: hypothetical protein AAB563_01090 [Patescibacteria group bacterium]
MDPEILTEQEEQVADWIRSTIYQKDLSLPELRSAVGSLPEDRQELIVNNCLLQLAYEQSLRRKFVVSNIVNQEIQTTPEEGELLVLAVATNQPQAGKVALDQSKITDEVKGQAKIFTDVAKRLEQLELNSILIEKVNGFFEYLDSLDDQSLNLLTELTKSYFIALGAERQPFDDGTPPVETQLRDLIAKAGLGSAFSELKQTDQIVEFLSRQLIVAEGILTNRQQTKIPDKEKVKLALAEVFLAHGDTSNLLGYVPNYDTELAAS